MTEENLIEEIKGVGTGLKIKFNRLGIYSAADLISYFPRRYEDYSHITSIADIRPGMVSIEAKIKQVSSRYARRGISVTEAVASDSSGSVRLIWFNQPYRKASIIKDADYFISGKFELSHQRLSIINPSVEMANSFPVNTARILPIYRETKGLHSLQIRKIIRELMPLIRNMPEILPLSVIKKNNLMGYHEAIEKIHFPSSASDIEKAETRLGFNEVFELMLASLLNKQENEHEKSLSIPFRQTLARNFVKNLPFKLTDSQRIVVWRIYQDLQGTQPMNRLVEGDVGSGKTVVAAMAAIMAIKQDFQVAFMAPTEILARQHADTIYRFLQPLGLNDTVGLLVGGMPTVAKTKARKAIATGKMKMIIGTQTLIQESINMDRLGLIIIDEQHRFGVEQRKALMAKAGHMPHVLSLTATPIPRSLALVVYGELDISILSQKPVGRKAVITKIFSDSGRVQAYRMLDKQIEEGNQAFIVCPLITENDFDLSQSAEKVYDRLSHHEFKHRKLGLLHGRMASAQKTKVLEDFLNRKIDILIATTVVEVGIDIQNANCILIESAERFGLAQIHQLRGRVGRAGQQAYCFLVTSDNNPPSRRLTTLETVNDGFRLAEIDLKLRGPGAVYGVAQHGQLDLRFAELSDHKLIAAASESAGEFIKSGENLLKYGVLAEHVGKLRAVTNLN